jgi:Xaa-Pro aminopeptidase
VDDLIAREAYRHHYMHNTSHWLGLDAHDVGDYRLEGEHRPLQPGMVFTVEPGIYLANSKDLTDPRFAGIGVRIEDDVAIEADGYENLTAAIPKEPGDIETLVGSGTGGAR